MEYQKNKTKPKNKTLVVFATSEEPREKRFNTPAGSVSHSGSSLLANECYSCKCGFNKTPPLPPCSCLKGPTERSNSTRCECWTLRAVPGAALGKQDLRSGRQSEQLLCNTALVSFTQNPLISILVYSGGDLSEGEKKKQISHLSRKTK